MLIPANTLYHRVMYFTLPNSAIISLSKRLKPARLYPLFPISIQVPLFSIFLPCNSISI